MEERLKILEKVHGKEIKEENGVGK